VIALHAARLMVVSCVVGAEFSRGEHESENDDEIAKIDAGFKW
jgi:hypothetical protein